MKHQELQYVVISHVMDSFPVTLIISLVLLVEFKRTESWTLSIDVIKRGEQISNLTNYLDKRKQTNVMYHFSFLFSPVPIESGYLVSYLHNQTACWNISIIEFQWVIDKRTFSIETSSWKSKRKSRIPLSSVDEHSLS